MSEETFCFCKIWTWNSSNVCGKKSHRIENISMCKNQRLCFFQGQNQRIVTDRKSLSWLFYCRLGMKLEELVQSDKSNATHLSFYFYFLNLSPWSSHNMQVKLFCKCSAWQRVTECKISKKEKLYFAWNSPSYQSLAWDTVIQCKISTCQSTKKNKQ